jgi:hypothetical protein
MLTDYTTYNDVRAALGVSEEDIPDEVLSLNLYGDTLTQEFEEISLTLESTYISTIALPTPTDIEVRFISACSLFAAYSVAKQLTAAMPLFAAKQVTDGKAQVSRFDNPYKDVIAQVTAQYEKARSRLVAAYGLIVSVTTVVAPKVYFGVVSPSVDPVTGV